MYSTFSAVSEAWPLDSNVQDCDRLDFASSTPIDERCSRSIGLESPAPATCTSSTLEMFPGLISSLEALPASAPASPRRSKASARVKPSGPKWRVSSKKDIPNTRSSSNPLAIPGGKLKLRAIWRALAITHPDLNDRLAIVARLISAGACSLLPTPCSSDAKRWPGSPNHPRLNRARGLRLQEELGCRPGPEIIEWMMGFPPGWTELPLSATPCFPETLKQSDEP
jgi:hypothetical protein